MTAPSALLDGHIACACSDQITCRLSGIVDQIATGKVNDSTNYKVSEEAVYQRMDQIGASATAAFLWLDSHEQLRKGLKARSTPPSLATCPPGTQVCYYRQQAQARRLQHLADAPSPPCVVVTRIPCSARPLAFASNPLSLSEWTLLNVVTPQMYS